MLNHSREFIRTAEADRLGAAELERVVRAARTGDAGAWSALVDRFAARVRRVARRHRLAAHDVEDVVQTTWLRLFEHIDGVREAGAMGAWLETTARRESLRLLNAGRLEDLIDAEPDGGVEGPVDEQRLAAAEQQAALRTALSRLRGRERALFSLLLADPQPSYSEIARALDMPIGSIGPTRARCLERLRRDRRLAGVVADGTA